VVCYEVLQNPYVAKGYDRVYLALYFEPAPYFNYDSRWLPTPLSWLWSLRNDIYHHTQIHRSSLPNT